MKRMNLAKTLAVTLVGFTARAATVVTIGPASDCPTYCSGFRTDNPAVTIDWINSYYNGTTLISVNGVVYRGNAAFTLVSQPAANTTIMQESNIRCVAADGTAVTLSESIRQIVTHVNSGRAHYTLTRRFVLGGTVTLP